MTDDIQPPICDYEGYQYQSRFWEEGQRAYEDAVEAIALERLLPAGGEWLIDLGAGAGRNVSRYRNFDHIVLLDYSLSQLQQARQRLEDGRAQQSSRVSRNDIPKGYLYVAANIYHLPFAPAVFDVAVMVRVLHHLVDARRATAEIGQMLKPGGVFILEFANKRNLKAILRYLCRRQNWNPFGLEAVEFAPLHFDFHPRFVRQCLQESGLIPQRQLTVSHFRLEILKRRMPHKLLVTLDSWLQLSGDIIQLSPSVFVKAVARGGMSLEEHLSSQEKPASALPTDLFRCPACGSLELQPAPASLDCPACARRWPIQDGIYDFRFPPAASTTQ